MRKLNLIFSIAVGSLLGAFLLISSVALASPTEPNNYAEYITLKEKQPVPEGKKIEVIEFFMYHCPACNMLEPVLDQWVKKQGDNIIFKRIHLARKPPSDTEARLYLTLEALHKEGAIKNFAELHKNVFHTWHVEHNSLLKEDKILDWAEKRGIDRAKFKEAYDSFAVTSKLPELSRIATNYQVDSTPTLVVDGRYQTNLARVSENNPKIPKDKLAEETMKVLDALVEKARADSKK